MRGLQSNSERRYTRALLWLLLVPALVQLALLCAAMVGRLAYPYDLEWMEGGLLTHVERLADGRNIYVAPSVEFIPYLYTPLYPALLAILSPVLGIGYGVGRAVSIASTIGLCVLLPLIVRRESEHPTKQSALVGGGCAIGFFAATYPWVEGWYDLVRADSLFLFMVVWGLWGLRKWALAPGRVGIAKFAAAAAVLALSFFAKQTGILFVATGGFLLLALNWRRVPLYVVVTGVLGLGGTWLLSKISGTWFWVYIYKTHQHHDFNMDRFYKSFGYMLWHFPLMSIVIALGTLLMLATLAKQHSLPKAARGLALWLPIFAVSVLVGAIGWGTQFAHFNAYVPAMFFGALCAGLAIPSIAACLTALTALSQAASSSNPDTPWPTRVAALATGALALQLALALWNPRPFIPSDAERRAGDKLIATIGSVEGDVLIPYHPWYAHLAGKATAVHLMGLRDMSTGKVWTIRGLQKALAGHQFGAIFMDNRPVGRELAAMKRYYRVDDLLPSTAAPHVFTGAGAVWNKKVATLVPRSIWVPKTALQPPADTRILWNFESGTMAGWASDMPSSKASDRAWGQRPERRSLPKQGAVRRYGGQYYLTSFHGGDQATGTLRSTPFILDGETLSFRIAGGHSEQLRVELHVSGEVVRTETGDNSEGMRTISWDVSRFAGQSASLVLVDEATGSWGHINVDEFWLR